VPVLLRLLGLVVLLLTAVPAMAEKRVALVLGNAAYKTAPLKNPVNDARAMAAKLRQLGFQVILRENATKLEMERAVADFGDQLGPEAVGLFFYAGHGIQVDGRNFLVPTDASIATQARVRLETLDVDLVLDQMAAAQSRVNLVILDACRNNPFERRFRATGGGLAQINAPQGTLISYATAPGKVAADGAGDNGLYTAELLRALDTPGLQVEEVFKRVRIEVSKASQGNQTPWEASSLTGSFYFRAGAAPAAAASPATAPDPTPAPAAPSAADRETAFWNSIQNSNDPALFEAYMQQFPFGTFEPIARARIEALLQAASPLVAAAPPAAAEPARQGSIDLAAVYAARKRTAVYTVKGSCGVTYRLSSDEPLDFQGRNLWTHRFTGDDMMGPVRVERLGSDLWITLNARTTSAGVTRDSSDNFSFNFLVPAKDIQPDGTFTATGRENLSNNSRCGRYTVEFTVR